MFDFKNYTENSATRPGIYCVWIPACPGKETPLIRVWIDPSMSAFESQAATPDRDAAAASRDEAAQVSLGNKP
ncbi:MAG TPA: hypothetical protein VNZ63_13355 [Verrucomicrobiae bacterium]|jgi:hypothetical protein|nr:hypothetical protein [Verrucomicrobiae bacterium]